MHANERTLDFRTTDNAENWWERRFESVIGLYWIVIYRKEFH